MKTKKRLIVIFIIALIAFTTTSCATLNDPAFHEGFRQGWNTTAPPQYRY